MSRKQEIIYATLELASEYGLKAVSLSQIADRIGIKKPSLYNHFKSKEEIVSAMYAFLRENAKKKNSVTADFTALFERQDVRRDSDTQFVRVYAVSVCSGYALLFQGAVRRTLHFSRGCSDHD